MGSKNTDWVRIETEFRLGLKSNRQIASEHGINEITVRRRAKKYNWIKDGAAAKRARVDAAMVTNNADTLGVAAALDNSVAEDVADMNLGLENARLALRITYAALSKIAEGEDDAAVMTSLDGRNLKVLSETNRHNIEVIRRIRSLDDQDTADAPLSDEDYKTMERWKQANDSASA